MKPKGIRGDFLVLTRMWPECSGAYFEAHVLEDTSAQNFSTCGSKLLGKYKLVALLIFIFTIALCCP